MLYIWLNKYNKYFSPGVCDLQMAQEEKKKRRKKKKQGKKYDVALD